jgi:hypothetical protein
MINYSYCIAQRETSKSKTEIERLCGVVEAPPDIKPAGLKRMFAYFFFSISQSCSF